ncbi:MULTISPECIES: hypothetical protein [Aeromonas]|uniref:Uncharacterized protein n=1 Tax=Aeromonas veronii TaxID=654 RepID=A0A4S5CJX8_AERVE|nr:MULTISPECIES: hypothetical protein [Aeromonas]THJ43668.1 hypothetical protein E8Q35_15290 [Aeromonas veronii]
MDVFEAINFLTLLPSLILSMAIVTGLFYGIQFLFGMRSYGSSQARGQGITTKELIGTMLGMVVMIQFPTFIQDSVLTMTGSALEPVNPLSWGAIGKTDQSETLMATLLYRFFQVFGMVTLFSFGTTLPKLNDPQQRGQITWGSLCAKFVAGVMLFMPSETSQAIGVIFPLVGAFGEWMSQNRL